MTNVTKRLKVKRFKEKIGLKEDLEINDGDSGVYIIYSISTDWCYIGETNNLKTRFGQHCSALRCNKHNRKKLQEIYNNFGEEDLVYIPVFKCPVFMRKEVEKAYTYKLGLKTVNVEHAWNGFEWKEIEKEKIMLEAIPKKYRMILKVYKEWKYKDYWMTYNEYLDKAVKEGIEIKDKGFKWMRKSDSFDNMKIVEEYRNKYNDFLQMQLDYIAIAILNDILGQEENYDMFYRDIFNHAEDFNSDDLIYNIYKEIRKDNIFRNDIIKASIALMISKNNHYKHGLENVKYFEKKLEINNVFDLLYVYIINIIITEFMKIKY